MHSEGKGGAADAERRSPTVYVIAGILAVALLASALAYAMLMSSADAYNRAGTAVKTARDVLVGLLNQETGIRGYIITGQPVFLEPYREARDVENELTGLRGQIAELGLPGAQAAVHRLIDRYHSWRQVAEELLARPAPPLLWEQQAHGKRLMDRMRGDVQTIVDASRTYEVQTTHRVQAAFVAGSIALVFAIALLGIVGIRVESVARVRRRHLTDALDARNRELERSNKALQDFAYVASHDLQEPLRTVSSYTQLLSRRYGDKLGPDGNEFIAYAADAAKRMQQLINDLLTYSRVDTHARPPQPVSSAAELDAALANLAATVEASGARISHGPLPVVLAQPGRLAIVFQNLVGNALKYRSPERPPEVRVEAGRLGDMWEFSVRDNGIGIEPEHFERIFKMFQRLHARAEYEGTGIGLALVRRIVELAGGKVRVESAPGEGSTFFFTIPVVPAGSAIEPGAEIGERVLVG